MATTGTYTYDIIGSGIITDALRILGVIEEGGSATSTQISDALPTFEKYIKSLSKYGLNLWTINSEGEQITLVASTASYSLTNPALKILECHYRDSDGNDTVMIPLTREEYWNLNDKDQTGQPTQFFFDPNANAGTLYVWPVPDSTYADDLYVVYQTLIQDVDGGDADASEHIDVPAEWLETITFGLAARLAHSFGKGLSERKLLIAEYEKMLQDNLDWDTEQESVYFRPAQNHGN